jgi:hypothetical protein
VDGWDIEPAGVRGVLGRTQTVAQQFEDELGAIGPALQGAAENSSSAIVATAVEGFASAVQGDIRFALDRTTAALRGAGEAMNAYVHGDLQMAANAQAAASAVLPR